MQRFLPLFFLLMSLNSLSQTFTHFKSEDFEIEFPEKWIVLPKEKFPQLALIVYRKPESKSDKAQVTINVNVIANTNSDLNKSFGGLAKSISDAENFKILETGSATIRNENFKWLIETHLNYKDSHQQMHNYVFVAYKDNKTYILTMVVFSEVFETYKPIFDVISQSFVIN